MSAELRFDTIRDIVARHGRLGGDPSTLAPDSNLYEAGLSSLTTVHLMLALEEAFDVEFPDRLLGRRTFESIRSIAEAIDDIGA
jgi:acyl carrier protein